MREKSNLEDFDEGSEAAVDYGIKNDSITQIFFDTGASTNLMQAEKLFRLDCFRVTRWKDHKCSGARSIGIKVWFYMQGNTRSRVAKLETSDDTWSQGNEAP